MLSRILTPKRQRADLTRVLVDCSVLTQMTELPEWPSKIFSGLLLFRFHIWMAPFPDLQNPNSTVFFFLKLSILYASLCFYLHLQKTVIPYSICSQMLCNKHSICKRSKLPFVLGRWGDTQWKCAEMSDSPTEEKGSVPSTAAKVEGIEGRTGPPQGVDGGGSRTRHPWITQWDLHHKAHCNRQAKGEWKIIIMWLSWRTQNTVWAPTKTVNGRLPVLFQQLNMFLSN